MTGEITVIMLEVEDYPVLKEAYLGDAVYASWDGHQIKLTVSDGVRTTNTIYLNPAVMKNLGGFYIDCIESIRKESPNGG